MEQNYFIAPITNYNDENERWETKVGIRGKNKIDLHYSVWGLTAKNSLKKAEQLAEILTKHHQRNKQP